MSEQQQYHKSIRIIHWVMAVLIILMIPFGFFMEDLPQEFRGQAFGLHKSIGVSLLILAFVRVISRNLTHAPEMPDQIKPLEVKLAKLGHYALYLLICIMPLSGWVMSDAAGKGVQFFGIPMPVIAPQSQELRQLAYETHEYAAFAAIALISIHVAAVVKHRVKDKVNLLTRIYK